MTKEELELIQKVDILMEKYDPCQIRDGSCLRMRTIETSEPFCCDFFKLPGAKQCQFLKDGKCTFINSRCKLWFCETVARYAPLEFVKEIKKLEDYAFKQGWVHRYGMGHGYVGRTLEVKQLNEKSKR